MKEEITSKQQRRLFFFNILAFGGIFLLLGLIILQLMHSLAYQQTDKMLRQVMNQPTLVQLEIARFEQEDLFNSQGESLEKQPPDKDFKGFNRFNTQMILWSKSGEILNKTLLGGRLNELNELTLDKKKLGKVKELSLNNGQLSFHSITYKYESKNSAVAYVQILANTNQVSDSMGTFQMILVICMLVFWLLSIIVSFYLAKANMQPILKSWHKQQEFVENASHELRTPLTIIQNSLQKLFTQPNHTIMEESETIAQALNETRRLNGLTADLLTIARSDSNQLILEKSTFHIDTFLAPIVEPFIEMAEIEEKTFTFENLTSDTIHADHKRLHQLVVILLDNALKYTDTKDSITVLSKSNGQFWQLEVKNTGPSINEEHKAHLFERFYREDASRNQATGGYGLGLTIAWQIIHEHQGKIEVLDILPRGVNFRVTLPLKPKS